MSICCDSDHGCESCRVYVCQGCGRFRSWDNGGTDSPVCDDCWYQEETRRKEQWMTVQEMIKEAYACAASKGFWDGVDPIKAIPTQLALIHSEVSEILEDYRAGKIELTFEKGGKSTAMVVASCQHAPRRPGDRGMKFMQAIREIRMELAEKGVVIDSTKSEHANPPIPACNVKALVTHPGRRHKIRRCIRPAHHAGKHTYREHPQNGQWQRQGAKVLP